MLYLLVFKLLLFFVEPNSKFALSFCRLRLLLKLLVSFWSRPISVNLCDATVIPVVQYLGRRQTDSWIHTNASSGCMF